MGLSSSMWTSVSGLLAHGEKMNVVGNNIANVSTIGFKSQRMDFNDYLYLSGGSTSGPTQIGAGVSSYAVIGDFSQGTLESTNSVTDMAIDGNGFFKVRQPNSEQTYYTRAGDFYFNADRQLQNPEGYRLQGWKIDNSTRLTFKSDSVNLGKSLANESAFQGTGTPVDIVLDSWYLEPQRTSSINFTMGLTSDGKSDRSTSTTSPMTALFDQWDATKNPPMADSSYATSSSIKVYDEGGNSHTLSVYYDQVATKATDANGNVLYEIDGLPAGYTMYEYVVTIPPEEDMRSYGGTGFDEETNTFTGAQPTSFYNDPEKGTNKMAGMLMTGHLIFDAAGNLVNQTAYTYGANADTANNSQCQLEPNELSSWQATKFSSNGLPVFCANFTGQPLANSVNEKLSATESQAQDYLVELDFGLRTVGDWNYTGSLDDLSGSIMPPLTNTETRISLATDTLYHEVKFSQAVAAGTDAAGKPTDATPAQWQGQKDDDIPLDLQEGPQAGINASQNPSIYLFDGNTRIGQISTTTRGPEFMLVNKTTGKEVTVDEYSKMTEAELENIALGYVGINGKPMWNENKLMTLEGANIKDLLNLKSAGGTTTGGNIEEGDNAGEEGGTDNQAILDDESPLKFSANGKLYFKDPSVYETYMAQGETKATFQWQRSLKKIPNSYLSTEYSQLHTPEGGGKSVEQPLDLMTGKGGDATVVYAISSSGQRMAVQFDDAGYITGVTSNIDKDGKPVGGFDKYDGQQIYFDQAVSSRSIDYNTDFSTFDDPIRAENATKAGSSSFITQDAGQNGYASGVLSGTNITADGVVYGYYDNGETVPLYQIALYDFHNEQGLRREGGNLYAQTRESGEARQGVAGEAGFGSVKAYNLEGSNVDLSREFVNMISTQRGFQANSKGITTIDTMLETVIGMKR